MTTLFTAEKVRVYVSKAIASAMWTIIVEKAQEKTSPHVHPLKYPGCSNITNTIKTAHSFGANGKADTNVQTATFGEIKEKRGTR